MRSESNLEHTPTAPWHLATNVGLGPECPILHMHRNCTLQVLPEYARERRQSRPQGCWKSQAGRLPLSHGRCAECAPAHCLARGLGLPRALHCPGQAGRRLSLALSPRAAPLAGPVMHQRPAGSSRNFLSLAGANAEAPPTSAKRRPRLRLPERHLGAQAAASGGGVRNKNSTLNFRLQDALPGSDCVALGQYPVGIQSPSGQVSGRVANPMTDVGAAKVITYACAALESTASTDSKNKAAIWQHDADSTS